MKTKVIPSTIFALAIGSSSLYAGFFSNDPVVSKPTIEQRLTQVHLPEYLFVTLKHNIIDVRHVTVIKTYGDVAVAYAGTQGVELASEEFLDFVRVWTKYSKTAEVAASRQ